MDYPALVEAVQLEGEAAVDILAPDPDPDILVPTCEHWTVADLVVHMGAFCGFWSHVLCEGTGRPLTPYPDPPEGPDLLPWLAELHGHLVGQLEVTPADTPVWTWFAADHSAGFVARRCAHELAVHRYDAESVHDACQAIPTALAVDGVDEIMEALVTVRDRTGEGTGRTLALRCTDAPVGWAVAMEATRIGVERLAPAGAGPGGRTDGTGESPPADGAGDLTVAGTASDLELTLYHLPALGPVEMAGDYTVLEEWYREFRF